MIMLATSDGLCKDMEVVATGSSISVPVGQKTLGRLFNVVGDTLDGLEDLSGEKHWGIHRQPPALRTSPRMWRFWRPVSRLSTC